MRLLLFLFVLHGLVEARTITTTFQLTVHFEKDEPRMFRVSLWDEDVWNRDDLLAWTPPRMMERCGEKWLLQGTADTDERQPYELYALFHFEDRDDYKCCRVPLKDCKEPGPCHYDLYMHELGCKADECRDIPDGYGPVLPGPCGFGPCPSPVGPVGPCGPGGCPPVGANHPCAYGQWGPVYVPVDTLLVATRAAEEDPVEEEMAVRWSR